MAGKRRSRTNSLIERVAYAETPEEKLIAGENALNERINRVRGDSESVHFLTLDLTADELKWIDLQIGHAFDPKRGVLPGKLIEKFPRMLVASLVGAASSSSTDNSFWPEWRRRVALSNDRPFETTVRNAIPGLLRKTKLKTYDSSFLGASEYVSRLFLHAGITAANIGDIVRLHEYRRREGVASADEAEEGSYVVNEMLSDENTPAALRRFFNNEPELGTFFASAICAFVDYAHENPNWYAFEEFEGTASLPELVFAELTDYLVHRSDSAHETERVFTKPAVYIDEASGAVHLQLTLPKDVSAARWAITVQGEKEEIVQRAHRATTDQNHQVIPLKEPSPTLNVELVGLHKEWLVDLYTNDQPIIFFTPSTGRRISSLRSVKPEPVIAVAPAGTSFVADDGQLARTIVAPQALSNWNRWFLYSIDFSNTESVSVRFAGNTTLNLVLDRREQLEIKTPGIIEALRGQDLRPVYSQSPTIRIPESDVGTWTKRIFYIYPDGTSEDVYGEALHIPVGTTSRLFEDSYGAWVGTYEVRIYKDDVFIKRRRYNLAEDIQVKFEWAKDNGGFPFRAPAVRRNEHGLTKALFQFKNAGSKSITYPQGWKGIAKNRLYGQETLETPDGYELQCEIVPPRLTFRFDRIGETSSWQSFAENLNSNTLDPRGQLIIRIPQKTKSARLRITDLNGAKAIRDLHLARKKIGGIDHYSVPLDRLLAELEGARHQQVTVDWKPDLNTNRYVKRSDRDGLAQLELDKSKEQNGCLAKLAVVKHEPILKSASITDETITIKPGRVGIEMAVWAWPLHNPGVEPVELALDGLTARLPDSLAHRGPLLLDAEEAGFAMFPTAPSRPTEFAILASQDGYWTDGLALVDRLSLAFISPKNPDSEQAEEMSGDPDVMKRLWTTTAAISNVAAQSTHYAEVNRVIEITRKILQAAPRAALESLGDSTVAAADKPAELIRSGLVGSSFSTLFTEGEFHNEGWVSLLLEIDDVANLHESGRADSREYLESWAHLESVGGDWLVRILRDGWLEVGDVAALGGEALLLSGDGNNGFLVDQTPAGPQPWISYEKRTSALIELYRQRRKLAELGFIRKHRKSAEWKENCVMSALRSQRDLAEILTTQRAKAEEIGSNDASNWAWVPYLSLLSALYTRLIAHNRLRADLPDSYFWEWSQIARCVPALTITDVLLAEALVTHHNHPELGKK